MKFKSDRLFFTFVILAVIALVGIPLIFKYVNNYLLSQEIKRNSENYFSHFEDPYLEGLSGEMTGGKSLEYKFKAKSEQAYLTLKENSAQLTNSVTFDTCLTWAPQIHKGVKIKYSYYYPTAPENMLRDDDPSLKFLEINVSKDICAQLTGH